VNGDWTERNVADDAIACRSDGGKNKRVGPPERVHQIGLARTSKRGFDNRSDTLDIRCALSTDGMGRMHTRGTA
jgi:hypothetical protein